MELILHIGLSKTGTSAIQNFLWKHKDELLRKYNLLYPSTGIFSGGGVFAHYFIAWALYRSPEVDQRIRVPSLDVISQNLKYELEKQQPEAVILSSEFFMQFRGEYLVRLKDFIFNLFDNLKIIVYLRRQDQWFESSYIQSVKAYSSRIFNEFKFSAKMAPIDLEWLLDYYKLLSRWKQAFPEAEIIPRIYDRKLFPDGNVILDFLSVLGIDMPEAREYKIEVNPSLSHLSTLVMRRINEEFDLSPEDHGKVVNYLLQLDKKEGSPIKTFFTLQERIEFLERFRESNEKLFREYFGTENQFVLSPEEIEFYKEQDKIPREVIEKAVEERYRKVLEFMKANGILAKEKLFPKVSISYFDNNLDFFRIDVLNANLLNGRLIIGGLALPKADVEGLKLTIKDAEGIKEVQWGLPSPVFGEQRKDNPMAKNARFRVDNVAVGDKPIEVFVNDKKVAEIRIKI